MDRIESLIIEGFQDLMKENYENALEAFNKVLVLDSNNLEARRGLLIIYNDTDRYQEAIELADFLMEKDPEDLEYCFYKANALCGLESFDESLELLNIILERDSEYVHALHVRSMVKLNLEDLDGAMSDINQCISSGAKDEYTLTHRGSILLSQQKYHDALSDFDNALAINKDLALAKYNRGVTLRMLGENKKALKDVDQYFVEEVDSEILHQRSIILKNLNRDSEALDDLNRAIEMDQKNVEAFYSRGILQSKLGNYQEALSNLKQAEELNKEYFQDYLLNGYSEVYRKMKDFNSAIDYAKKALKFNPQFFWANATLAEIHSDMGDNEEFYKYLELAVNGGFQVTDIEESIKEKYKSDPRFTEYLKREKIGLWKRFKTSLGIKQHWILC